MSRMAKLSYLGINMHNNIHQATIYRNVVPCKLKLIEGGRYWIGRHDGRLTNWQVARLRYFKLDLPTCQPSKLSTRLPIYENNNFN